ncbi:MAG: hypothetical protein ACK422_07485, partial [Burkholderiales bacterium]
EYVARIAVQFCGSDGVHVIQSMYWYVYYAFLAPMFKPKACAAGGMRQLNISALFGNMIIHA